MTRYLLDTKIISNLVKSVRSQSLVDWISQQADEDLFIASLSLAEIYRGLLLKPEGKKKRDLERWFSGFDGPKASFAERILPLDDKAAFIWARLMAEGSAAGRPRSAFDMIIAATGVANDCVIVTDNEKDFIGLKMINPSRV